MDAVTIRVPASAANLGPGYDAFGLALGLYNTFSAQPAEEWHVDVRGEGAGRLATDGHNRVAQAMKRAFRAIGSDAPRAARITCDNRIPTARGLGSSAAAIVGGLVLADALCDSPLGRDRLLELAVELEGHPDNVAAALLGGFTIGWSDEGGPAAASLQPAAGLAAVVVISDAPLATRTARRLLPDVVPHADAAFTAGRAGLLAAGVALGRPDLIAAGLHDRLHEQYRASAVPDLEAVSEALISAGALGAALSGAGPTVIGLVGGDTEAEALAAAEAVARRASTSIGSNSGRREPLALPVDVRGAQVIIDR